MNLATVKKASEIVLEGITVEFEMRDKCLHGVTFTDKQGHVVKVAKQDYTSMAVLIPAAPAKLKRFQVSGTLKGVTPVNETFETEYEATTRKSEIERTFDYDEGVKLDVAEIEVEEVL